jgi:hypothetical protein
MDFPFKIKAVEPTHPEYQKFLDKLGTASRDELVAEASRISGITVHDVGNTSMEELVYSLRTLVNRRVNNMPDREGCMPNELKHLVIGHAGGSGKNWFFMGNAGNVHDYVNNHVPEGEKAWVLACETQHSRYFNKLEGRELTSAGQRKDRPRA